MRSAWRRSSWWAGGSGRSASSSWRPLLALAIARPHLRDDALIEHLGRSTHDLTLRFRTWVERTVALPAAKVRERLGIRLDADGTE